MKWKKYRIVTDNYLGFEVQHKYLLWPFWVESYFSNTHSTIEKAEKFIEGINFKSKVVKNL